MLHFPPSKGGISQLDCWYQEVSTNKNPPQACRKQLVNKSKTALKLLSHSIPGQEEAGWHVVKRETLMGFFSSQPSNSQVLRCQTFNFNLTSALFVFCLGVVFVYFCVGVCLIACLFFPGVVLINMPSCFLWIWTAGCMVPWVLNSGDLE